ncbi:hypothetical protein H5158_06300 [Pseudoalteromonas sp. SR45-6]|uniref:hypothetical protein n=1 Tax=Pseudoalteromonas sp. SR45-6 TaxID=2760927 RepID=UPI0016007A97|nr:hypothetical protein [Pseudoalteromonas sp. SR45-6]MBB1341251.1 hypothetical protein [Pseudoalteromonas sp. SR45-6]
MSLKEQLQSIIIKASELAKTWPSEKSEDMKFLTNYAYEKGWYLNEVFIFGLHHSITEYEQFDDAVIVLIEEDWDFYWKALAEYQPARAHLFEEIKKAHMLGLYGASIHLCFSQADGLFFDKFGTGLYGSRFSVAKSKFGVEINEFISSDSLELLAQHYKDGSILRRMFNETYNEILSKTDGDLVKDTNKIDENNLHLPNRHGVLHGIHTGYVNRVNSFKAIAFLLFILFSLDGERILKSV